MTAYATRTPLQLLPNPHMMSDVKRTTRRSSARLADKEDAPIANGIVHVVEKGKGGQVNGTGNRERKPAVNGSERAAVGGRGKRKLDYDEEDDGFLFTRTRSKRVKATPAIPVSEPVIEEVHEDAPRPAPAKKTRKKALEQEAGPRGGEETKEIKRRRSARNSGEKLLAEPSLVEVKKRRTKENGVSKKGQREAGKGSKLVQIETEPEESVDALEKVSDIPLKEAQFQRDTTKIALPFADTPIIRRNQEMRRGAGDSHRRSSLGMRGRRASSLIESGKSSALPHDQVDSSEFYKHIESESLPEPRRMKQLLTWCGTRALVDKPLFSSEDSHVQMAAREIQQQLLKDFSTKSEMSDWFSREETVPHPQPPKPNPKNISNIAKIQELEQQIAHLQLERQTWENLLRPPATNTPSLLPLPSQNLPIPSEVSPELLASPTQTAALETLQSFQPTNDQPSLQDTATQRLRHVSHNIEFEIDKFSGNVHALGQYKDAAERVATEILGMGARALEKRDRSGGGGGKGEGEREREVDVREVLRGLSRVVER